MLKKLFTLPHIIYKNLISPFFPAACRFHPTCSQYSKQAILRHGVFKGGILTIFRLLKCQPFGPSGIDEVPEEFNFKQKKK